ncbi:MAG: hypothetical protein EXR72_15485 [Myxococcales bacterium]|nr:hypothetical protein [Myxococcales bacterium]
MPPTVDDRIAALRETLALVGVRSDVAVDATIALPAGAATSGSLPAHPSLPTLSTVQGAGGADETRDLVIVRRLGEGGMGRVELARQRSLEREVAVETVRPDRVDAGSVEQLIREARITGSLEHPNIVPVHALARTEQGAPVLVMKHVEGVAWAARWRDRSGRDPSSDG